MELESISDSEAWLDDVMQVLSVLYACAYCLPDVELSDDSLELPEEFYVKNGEWKQIFDLVKEVLGEQSLYWIFYDPSTRNHEAEPTCSDLADDLADIYRDLKPGLRAWELNEDRYLNDIVSGWKEPLFGSHWGVHAVSALYAMHFLIHLRGIE